MKDEILRIISGESLKASRRRSTFLVPVLAVTVSLLVFLGVDFASRRDWIGLSSGFYLTASTLGWMVNLIGLFAVIATCFQISGEFAQGTVKPAWVRPLSRESWYMGKILTVAIAVTLVYFLTLATVVAASAVGPGFTDLMEKDYLVHSAGSMGWKLVLVSSLTLWSLYAVIAVSSLVSSAFNRPGGAIATIAVLSLVMGALSMFPATGPFLLTDSLSAPFEQMIFMSKGLPLPLEWGTLVQRGLSCGGAWMAVAAISALAIIRKKEITF